MAGLGVVKKEIIELAETTHKILTTAFKGFMENDLNILMEALKEEEKLNAREKLLNDSLIKLLKEERDKKAKSLLITFTDFIGQVGRIGAHCTDLIERMEIKISENLYFSNEAVNEYKDLFNRVETLLKNMADNLQLPEEDFSKRVSKTCQEIKDLADKYAKNHMDRLARGICDPRAARMFLDMLDATRSISFHSCEICKACETSLER